MPNAFDQALAAEQPQGQKLRIDKVLAALDDTDPPAAKAARKALRDKEVPVRQVARAFRVVGHPVSENAVANWRLRYLP